MADNPQRHSSLISELNALEKRRAEIMDELKKSEYDYFVRTKRVEYLPMTRGRGRQQSRNFMKGITIKR